MSHVCAEWIVLIKAVAHATIVPQQGLVSGHGPRRELDNSLPIRRRKPQAAPYDGIADGLLEEIQNEVLDRHPDWKQHIEAMRGAPFPIAKPGPKSTRRDRNFTRRLANKLTR